MKVELEKDEPGASGLEALQQTEIGPGLVAVKKEQKEARADSPITAIENAMKKPLLAAKGL